LNLFKYQLLIAYVLTLVVFLTIDLMWLGGFLAENVNWTAAFIFYMLYIVGIFIFCIAPATEKKSLNHAILLGALFGFFCYATYDLTNLATLKGWPSAIVYIDIVWGTFLTAAVSASGFVIVKWLQ
jgi:uncharacterized membrane protein